MKIIGERSEPPSDKLGGEISIPSRTYMLVAIYIRLITRIRVEYGELFHE